MVGTLTRYRYRFRKSSRQVKTRKRSNSICPTRQDKPWAADLKGTIVMSAMRTNRKPPRNRLFASFEAMHGRERPCILVDGS
jgi:hypothetical protein